MRVAEWVAEQPLGPPAGGVRVPHESEGCPRRSLPEPLSIKQSPDDPRGPCGLE